MIREALGQLIARLHRYTPLLNRKGSDEASRQNTVLRTEQAQAETCSRHRDRFGRGGDTLHRRLAACPCPAAWNRVLNLEGADEHFGAYRRHVLRYAHCREDDIRAR